MDGIVRELYGIFTPYRIVIVCTLYSKCSKVNSDILQRI